MRGSESFTRFVKYTLVSAICLFVDYGTYWVLVTQGLTTLPTGAVLGYSAGLVLSYFLISGKVMNDGWLKERKKVEFILFALSGLLGIGLTYIAIKLAVAIMGERIFFAKLFAVGISFIGVYIFRSAIVFRRKYVTSS